MAINPGFDVAALYNRAREMQAADLAEQQRQAEEQRQLRAQQLAAQQAEAERNRSRTWGEAAADTGIATVQTVANVLGAGYGLANMATLGVADRVTGVSESFESLNELLESGKSAPLRARKEDLQTTFDTGDYAGAAGELLTSPSMLLDYGVQSLGYLVPGMAAARVAGGVAAAGAAAKGRSALVQGYQAQQAATTAGLVAQGGMTAGYMNVDAINAAREAGRTPEEQQLYGLGAGAVGAVVGPAISKLTGAAGMEARAAQAFTGTALPSATGNLAGRITAGVGVQAVEEGAQESYEQVLRNIAGDAPMGEGVGQAATMGAVLGGIFGGALGATSGRQATRDEAAKVQKDVERELIRAGMAERGVISPSILSNWSGPAGMGSNAATRAAEGITDPGPADVDLPTVETLTPQQFAAQNQDPALNASLDALAQQQDVTEIDLDAAGLPLSESTARVEELTGARAILAQRNAQRLPQMNVQELQVEDVAGAPAAPQGAREVYQQTAPIAALRQRFGEETAAAEAQRRGPDRLNIDDVVEYFGPAEAGWQTALRQQAPVQEETTAPTPIDLTVPRVKRDYLRSMKETVAQATGRQTTNISGKNWNELIAQAAAEGITPQSPEFGAFMAVKAEAGLRQAEQEGRDGSDLLGAITNAYPISAIPAEQQADAIERWGGVPVTDRTSEDALFGAEPTAPAAQETPRTKVRPQDRQTLGSLLAGLGGIGMDYQMDITGDRGKQANKNYRGGKNLFTSGGTSLDDAAMRAWEAGYITDADYANLGGVPKLTELLQRLYQGEKIYPIDGPAFRRQMEDEYAARSAEENVSGFDSTGEYRRTEEAILNRAADLAGVEPRLITEAYGSDAQMRTDVDTAETRLMPDESVGIPDGEYIALKAQALAQGYNQYVGRQGERESASRQTMQRFARQILDSDVATPQDKLEAIDVLNPTPASINSPLARVAANETKLTGLSNAAQKQSAVGAVSQAYTDAIQAVVDADSPQTLNIVVRTIRGSPLYAEFSNDQKMELETRIAEHWGVLDGMDFHLAATIPANPDIRFREGGVVTGAISQQRFDSIIDAAPARLGIQVQGVNTVAELSAQLGRELPLTVKGVYTKDKQLFIVRENHTSAKDVAFTIAHEQGHQGLDALLGTHLRAATRRMWANGAMRKRIKTKMSELNLQTDTEANTSASRALAAEEVLADMLASGERLNKDIWAKLRAGVKEFMGRVFGVSNYMVTNAEVDTLLSDVGRVLRGETPSRKYGPSRPDAGLWITDPTAAAAVDDKFSKLNAEFAAMLNEAQNENTNQRIPPLADFAKSAASAAKDNSKSIWSQLKNGEFKDVLVKNFMHLNQLSSFYDKLFGGRISNLADLKTALESTFNKMNARKADWDYNGEKLGNKSVNDFAHEWAGFGRRQPAKYKALNTMMSQATFYKVFPDRAWDKQSDMDYEAAGYTLEARQEAHQQVQDLWKAIGVEGQRIYKTTQAMYADRWNTRYATLIKELDRIGKTNQKQNPEGSEVIAQKIATYKDDIRLALGKIKEGPYSPLQRNGKHTVVVTDADTGSVLHFSAYDTREAGQATAAQLREYYETEIPDGNYNIIQSTRAEFDSRLAGTSVGRLEADRRRILADVESMLPSEMDAAARAQVAGTVSDALTEAYLAGLPDSAFMKHARSRKNVAGYDVDAFRAFADYQLRSARDIAGIEYDGQIANALNEIETFAKDVTLGKMRPDGTEGVYTGDSGVIRDVTEAVKRQHAASLDVGDSKIVGGLIQGGYLWFMTSPSQMFLNVMQTVLVAFPRLAARYGGGKSRRQISLATGQFFKSKGSLLGDASVLRKDPTAANTLLLDTLQQLHDNGPLDMTQAHQVSEYAGGRNAALTPYMSKVLELASFFMHRSEVFNREVTSAAAVRLELESRGGNIPKKGTPEYNQLVQDMTKVGTRAIDDTHFNYAQSNKPPVMQGGIGKLVTQFQQHRFHMLALIARDIRDARLGKAILDPAKKAMGKDVVQLSPMDAAEAREARAALSWLLGVNMAFTGAAGSIMAPFVFAIMDAFKDDDDLTNSRTDFINYFGKYISHGVLAGVVDTQRISMSTLIPYLGEKDYEPVGADASTKFEYHMINNLGPWLGLVGDALDGGAAILNGDMYKASQELLPKPLRDVIKAPTEAINGVKDARGIVYNEPSVLSSFTAFLGLRSAERRDITEARSSVYRANNLARTAKDRYLNRLALAQSEGDRDAIIQAEQDIQQWNQKYPDLGIKAPDVRQALVGRMRTQQVASETGISASRMPSETIRAILGQQSQAEGVE